MKNLESIINRDMVDWLFTTIEIILKDDILVTLPKKKYEKMLVQDLLQLIKSYPGFLDIKSTIIPLISLTGSILQHTTSLELGDCIKADLIDYLKVKALTKGSHISTSSSVILERFTGNSNSANQRILSEDLKFANGVRLSKKTESGWIFEAFEKNDWKAFYEFDLVDGIKDEDYFQDMLDFVSIPSNNSFPLNGKFCCRVFPDLSQVIIYGDMAPNGEGITVVRLDGTGNILEKSKVLMEKEFREVMIKLFEIDIYQIAI